MTVGSIFICDANFPPNLKINLQKGKKAAGFSSFWDRRVKSERSFVNPEKYSTMAPVTEKVARGFRKGRWAMGRGGNQIDASKKGDLMVTVERYLHE